MKIQASIILTLLFSATGAWANQPGTGAPSNFEFCEHNAQPVRSHRPTNIVKAEEALESAEANLERLEREFEKADQCQEECRDTVYRVIELTVGERNLQDYLDYLGGSFECFSAANSARSIYNMYAHQNGWNLIQDVSVTPSRMIAENKPPKGGGGTISLPDELGDSGRPAPVDVERPTRPAPQNQQCLFMGPENTLDLSICREAQRQGLDGRQASLCRRCLGPRNEYGNCLRRRARLEQELYEAQDLLERRQAELDEARANPSSSTTCTDCLEDNRSWWQRLLPTAAATALVAVPGYFAYRQAQDAYDYAINVTHPNNARLGYPSQPAENLSGYQFAAHLINGAPII